MKQKIPFVFHLMYVIFWIVFIGLSIKAGVLVVSFIVSLAVSAQAASDLYMGLDLSELHNFDKYHYIAIMVLAIILAMLVCSRVYDVISTTPRSLNWSNPRRL